MHFWDIAISNIFSILYYCLEYRKSIMNGLFELNSERSGFSQVSYNPKEQPVTGWDDFGILVAFMTRFPFKFM